MMTKYTIFFTMALFSLANALPALKFSAESDFSCDAMELQQMKQRVNLAVNTAAIEAGFLEETSTHYISDRRNIVDKRNLGFCRETCAGALCWLNGCYRRRKSIRSARTGEQCDVLERAAAAQVEAEELMFEMEHNTLCKLAVKHIKIACSENP